MEYSAYKICTRTNMHVGSGDTTFSVIDNTVQRDLLTKYPTIHSSSLKGALREFFQEKSSTIVTYIFGSAPKDKENQIPGKYRFFDGSLLSYPVRSKNEKLFYRATTVSIIKKFLQNLSQYNLTDIDFSTLTKLLKVTESGTLRNDGEIEIEDYTVQYLSSLNLAETEIQEIEALLGKNVVILDNNDFNLIIEELPVIARNHLENGESKNLWYEEIIPRESIFYFFVGLGIEKEKEKEVKFNDCLKSDLVQIGGNASIGYGFSSITKI